MMLLPVVMITCYLFNDWLVPHYLQKKNYFYFTLYSVYLIVLSVYLELVVMTVAFIVLAQYSMNEMIPVTGNVVELALVIYFFAFVFAFISALKSMRAKEQEINLLRTEIEKSKKGTFIIRSDRKNIPLLYDEVMYIESLSDYVKIYIKEGSPIITKTKISKLETELPANFIRIHRSFIINQQHVVSFLKDEVMIGSVELPISRKYQKLAVNKLTNTQ